MLQNLFSSNVRVELLSTFFLHPDKELYVREIERRTGQNRQNIIRELRNLSDIGLLHSRKQGNLKYYGLNKDFIIYQELKAIFLKTRGAVAVIKKAFSEEIDIDFAFIYGSLAYETENEKSDIDLMVIGKTPLETLLKLIREPEKQLNRDINPSLFELEEIRKRLKEKDPFVTEVMDGPKIILRGSEDELQRAVE
jgi:predicted nucleotidyltransferase